MATLVVGGEDAPGGLIGRQPELATIARFLEALPAAATALVIEGEAGIGKTTLWHSAVAAARRASFRVMSCRPSQFETGLPYLGLGDLFADVPESVLAGLPVPQRRALEIALLRADARSGSLQQRALSVAVSNALSALARPGPLLLAIDDTQWLDVPTRNVLRSAFRRIPPAPIGVLLTIRSGTATEEDPLGLGTALAPDQIHRMPLGPLDLPSLERLLHLRLSAMLTGPTLRRLEQTCGGNPFFALELGRLLLDVEATGLPGEPLPAPSSLTELLGARLLRLPRALRRQLLTVAALSRPTVDLVCAADGGPRRTETLEPAVDTGLIEVRDGTVRFTHPLLASVLYSQATAGDRRHLHRRLAGLVGDPEERARHLALSVIAPDEEVAAAIDDAAVRAARRGAPDAAAALLEQATRLTPPDEAEHVLRRTLDAADQHLAAGDTARARVLFDQVSSVAGGGAFRARALHRLGRIRILEARLPEATESLERALAAVGEDLPLRVAIERDLVFTLMQRGRMDDAVSHARGAVRVAEASGDPAWLADALYCLGMVLCIHGEEPDPGLLERAAAVDRRAGVAPLLEHPGPATGRLPLATILKFSDRFDEARALLRSLHAEHAEHGDETALPTVLFQLGELECWAGNLDEAACVADEMHQVADRTAQALVAARAITLDAMVWAYRGDAVDARAKAGASLAFAEAAGDLLAMLRSLRSLGLVELSLGRPEEAVSHLQRGVEIEEDAGVDRAVSRILPDAVEALAAVGRLDDARRRVASLEAYAARHGRPWAQAAAARSRGVLEAGSGDAGAAHAALQRALQEHQRLGQPFELARTLLAVGRVERRAKQRNAARLALDQSVTLFESLGAGRWAELGRQELHRIGGRAATPFELTSTEQRVAELVAEGQTNREVGAALFMSVKTVETNLTRIYGKLGVSSRRELAHRPIRPEPVGWAGGKHRDSP